MAAYDRIKGSITALITPFKDGKVDESAYVRFIEWQIAEGTHGLVPCGTTGESPTITYAEQERAIAVCVETARGRVPVIAGAGSNSTEEAIELVPDLESALDRGLALTPAGGELVLLPTYTAMLGLQQVLAARGLARPYWERSA